MSTDEEIVVQRLERHVRRHAEELSSRNGTSVALVTHRAWREVIAHMVGTELTPEEYVDIIVGQGR